MAFTENNTLRELVDETTLIKEDVTNNRDALKANLENKGIETTEVSKLPDLINKVNEIEVEKHNLPAWVIFKDTYLDASYHAGYDPAYATVGKNIYVISGYSSSPASLINYNRMYDSETNTWYSKSGIPTKRNGASASTINDKIYVIGGFDNKSETCNTNECYDTTNNSWSTKAVIPTSRRWFSLNTIDKKFYAIGGLYDSSVNATDVNEQYDPVLDIWTSKTPMPAKRRSVNSSVIDKSIYIIGGVGSSNSSNYRDNFMYDTITDTWHTKTSVPYLGGNAITVTHYNSIHIVGGYYYSGSSYNYLTTHHKYDSISDTWESKSSMSQGRGFGSGGIINDNIYIFGGRFASGSDISSSLVYII